MQNEPLGTFSSLIKKASRKNPNPSTQKGHNWMDHAALSPPKHQNTYKTQITTKWVPNQTTDDVTKAILINVNVPRDSRLLSPHGHTSTIRKSGTPGTGKANTPGSQKSTWPPKPLPNFYQHPHLPFGEPSPPFAEYSNPNGYRYVQYSPLIPCQRKRPTL